jgi:hypothetical protein
MQEPRSAMLCAGIAAVLALLSWRLVRVTELARRLRGYAVAAAALTAIALAFLWMPPISSPEPAPSPGQIRRGSPATQSDVPGPF